MLAALVRERRRWHGLLDQRAARHIAGTSIAEIELARESDVHFGVYTAGRPMEIFGPAAAASQGTGEADVSAGKAILN